MTVSMHADPRASRWRSLARQTRTIAEAMGDQVSCQVMQELAAGYEALANRLEQEAPPSGCSSRPAMAGDTAFSMLKRHLRTEHQLTPVKYRERYELPRDNPLVSPNYAKVRSGLAKKIGLGRKAGSRAPTRLAAKKRR
jgi:hypothetical protein